jgi:signal peptidase II
MSPARRNDLVMAVLAALLIALDQLSKHWITTYFTTGASKQPIALVGTILHLEYDSNKGVAFSLLWGSALLFVLIAVALVVIGALYWRSRNTGSLALKASFGLILGGAAGNLLDRFTKGYVVDFIHFQIPAIHFNFAVFNVADSGICIGVVLLAFLLWRSDTSAKTKEAAEPVASAATPSTPLAASGVRVRRRVESSR